MADGRWQVGEDLLERLDAKDKEQPRRRFVVARAPMGLAEQVNHPGPVWLDRLSVEGLAPYGFGAELQKALAQRDGVLRGYGIEPVSPERHRALGELEYRTLASRIAADSGGKPLENIPLGFRGRVRIHAKVKGGEGLYAEIRDGDRFVLVPASRELRALSGQTVALSRDSEGRLQVRRLTRDRDRGGS